MADTQVCVNVTENGLQIGEAALSGAELDVRALSFDQNNLSFYEVTTDNVLNDEAKRLETLYNSMHLSKRNVNIIVPDSYSFSQILQMPKLKEKELLSAIKYQSDQFIPMPLEEASLDLEVIYEDKTANKLLVLIVAASQKAVARVEQLVEMAGLIPDSIESELSATSRLLTQFYKPKTPHNGSLFLSFGHSSSTLYFFHHQYDLVIDSHTFKSGKNLFSREIQSNTNFDSKKVDEILLSVGLSQEGSVDFEALLKPVINEFTSEIEKFTASMKEKYQIAGIDGLFLFGRAVDIHLFDQKLQKLLSIPTSYLDISSYVKKTTSFEAMKPRLPSFITTLGGCLR